MSPDLQAFQMHVLVVVQGYLKKVSMSMLLA
jgi:hypothetical protein